MLFTKANIVMGVTILLGALAIGTILIMHQAADAAEGQFDNADYSQPGAVPNEQPTGGEDEEQPGRNLAAEIEQSRKNLEKIGVALINWKDSQNEFRAARFDRAGKPLLSWRVMILPYLEEYDLLFRQFKIDEPWDSASNKKLLAKMPAIYAAPGLKTRNPTTTFYQVFNGKGALFDGTLRIKDKDVTDGLGRTIMIVEAGEAVPWTKPEDLTYDPEKELPKLGGVFKGDFNFVDANGSVHTAKKGFDVMKLRAAITRAGGEAVDLNNLNP